MSEFSIDPEELLHEAFNPTPSEKPYPVADKWHGRAVKALQDKHDVDAFSTPAGWQIWKHHVAVEYPFNSADTYTLCVDRVEPDEIADRPIYVIKNDDYGSPFAMIIPPSSDQNSATIVRRDRYNDPQDIELVGDIVSSASCLHRRKVSYGLV